MNETISVELLSTMKRVLVLGSGATGASAAAMIRRRLPTAEVVVVDKGRGAGGRMTTSRLQNGSKVDTGAQYFSVGPTIPPLFLELTNSAVLSPVTSALRMEGQDTSRPARTHYVAPEGANAVPKYFLAQAKPDAIQHSRRVTRLYRDGERISVVTVDDSTPQSHLQAQQRSSSAAPHGSEATDSFDAVICTIPAVQAVPLLSDLRLQAEWTAVPTAAAGSAANTAAATDGPAGADSTPDVIAALQSVEYSVTHVLAVSWSRGAGRAAGASTDQQGSGTDDVVQKLNEMFPYTFRYIDTRSVQDSAAGSGAAGDIRFISVDSRKRALASAAAQASASTGTSSPSTADAEPFTLLIHSKSYKEGVDPGWKQPGEGSPDLWSQLLGLYPTLAALPPPTARKVHRWRYGQVKKTLQAPGDKGQVDALLTRVLPDASAGASAVSATDPGDATTRRPQAAAPPLILAGDYFTGSNLLGCLRSGEAAAQLLIQSWRG